MSTLPPKKPPFVVGRRVAPPKPRVSARPGPVSGNSEKHANLSKDDNDYLKPDTARTRPRSNTVGCRPILSSCENKPSGSRKIVFDTVSEAKPADPAPACPTPAVRTCKVRITEQPDHTSTSDRKSSRTRPRAMTVIARPVSLTSSRARNLSQNSPEEMEKRARYADIEVFHTFAAGSSGCVRIVRYKGSVAAMKVVSKSGVLESESNRPILERKVAALNKEAEITAILSRSRSPYVVNVFDSFQDAESLYFIMEFVQGGSLVDVLAKCQYPRRCPSAFTPFFVGEVALGIAHLHSCGIMHRDIKPENILIGADGHLKICDMGFATNSKFSVDVVGSFEFMAPEILRMERYSREVDYYSLGVLAYALLTGGRLPFECASDDAHERWRVVTRAARERQPPSWPDPHKLSDCERELAEWLLASEPKHRLGTVLLSDTMSSPARGVPKEMMDHPFFAEFDWLSPRPIFQPGLSDELDTSCFTFNGKNDPWLGFKLSAKEDVESDLFEAFPSVVRRM